MITVFTSVNNAYIPKASILVESLKKIYPDLFFICVLSDKQDKNIDYTVFDQVTLAGGTVGLYAPIANFNGATFSKCHFVSNLTSYGAYFTYPGSALAFEGCYFETNGSYGLYIGDARQVTLTGCYFEANTTADIHVSSSGPYQTVVNLTGCHFEADTDCYSVSLSKVFQVNAIGNSFGAYSTDGAFTITPPCPQGIMVGNKWLNADQPPMTAEARDGFLWSDNRYAGLSNSYRLPAYRSLKKGEMVFNSLHSSPDPNILGWWITQPGMGTELTDPAVTATTTGASATVTLSAADNNILPGSVIAIAGENFGTGADTYAVVAAVTGTTTIILEEVANVGVAGAAITFPDAKYKIIRPTEVGTGMGKYSWAVDTGATGDYVLGTLPDNATITRAWYEVVTAPTSLGAATIALGVATNDATGILGATAYNDAAFTEAYHDGTPDGTATNFTTKTTAARNVVLTIGGATLTGGIIYVWWEFVVSQ